MKEAGVTGGRPQSKGLEKVGSVWGKRSTHLRACSSGLLLSGYVFNTWHSKLKFKDLLPQEVRLEFTSLVKEWKAIARASLQTALNATDLVTSSMASLVVMHRSSWLQYSGLLHEVQQTVQDIPFEDTLLKDSRATLKSLDLYTLVASRKHYRPQQSPWYFPQPARQDPQRKSRRDFRHWPSPPSSLASIPAPL